MSKDVEVREEANDAKKSTIPVGILDAIKGSIEIDHNEVEDFLKGEIETMMNDNKDLLADNDDLKSQLKEKEITGSSKLEELESSIKAEIENRESVEKELTAASETIKEMEATLKEQEGIIAEMKKEPLTAMTTTEDAEVQDPQNTLASEEDVVVLTPAQERALKLAKQHNERYKK